MPKGDATDGTRQDRTDTPQPATGAPRPEVAVRIRALMPSLPPAERRVATKIIEDPTDVVLMNINELAQACETSATTVIRFCRTVGFSGYPELRLTLATETGRAAGVDHERSVSSDINREDSLNEVVEKIAFADARAVEDTASQLDISVLGKVIDAIVGAHRVVICGVGASAFVALDFQQKLHRVGRVAYAWSDTHVALTSAALLTPQDVAIGISYTGVTKDTIDTLAEARRHGATTVALTNFPQSAIADVADLVLTTAARETTFRSGATASRLAQLTVVDCIFVGVARQTYDETQAALAVTFDSVRDRRVRASRR